MGVYVLHAARPGCLTTGDGSEVCFAQCEDYIKQTRFQRVCFGHALGRYASPKSYIKIKSSIYIYIHTGRMIQIQTHMV